MMRRVLLTMLLVLFVVSPLSARELSGTLQDVSKSGVIKLGYRLSQPPMSSMGKDGKPVGYSIDLCEQIAKGVSEKLGKDIKTEFVEVGANDRFDALGTGKIDILCGSTTKTIARGEIVDFTQLTFVTGASFMTLKGKKLRNNFSGKKIGVVKDTTTVVALKDLFADTDTGAKIVTFNTTNEALAALDQDKIDAFSSDQVVLIGIALGEIDTHKYVILPDLFSYEPFALAVRRNDADFRLVADQVISRLCRSEQILKIYDKWFSQFSARRNAAFEVLVELNATPEN